MKLVQCLVYFSLFCVSVEAMDVPCAPVQLPAQQAVGLPNHPIITQFCISDRQGRGSKPLRDAHFAQEWTIGNRRFTALGIFGGHGAEVHGAKIAELAANSCRDFLYNHLSQGEAVEGMLREWFKQFEDFVLSGKWGKDGVNIYEKSGTSALIILVSDLGETTIAWVGDVRAFVFNEKNELIREIEDHRPKDKSKVAELKKWGLRVERSLGDADAKNNMEPGTIISTPAIIQIQLNPGYSIIAGTAGFFEVMPNEYIDQVKKSEINLGAILPADRKLRYEIHQDHCNNRSLEPFVQDLRDEAFGRGSKENITVGMVAISKQKNSAIQSSNAALPSAPQTVSKAEFQRLRGVEIKRALQKLSAQGSAAKEGLVLSEEMGYFHLNDPLIFQGIQHVGGGDSLRLHNLPLRYRFSSDNEFNLELFKTKRELAEAYKIHLMPQNVNQLYTVLKGLYVAAGNDKQLQKAIYKIKFIPFPYKGYSQEGSVQILTWDAITKLDLQTAQAFFKNIKETDEANTLPFIVIYPSPGKAQYVLNQVRKLFKNQEGLDVAPRFNEHITSLIYVAQGHGDDKKLAVNAKYFEQPAMAYYVPWFETIWDENALSRIRIDKENPNMTFGEAWEWLQKELQSSSTRQARAVIRQRMKELVPEVRDGQDILQHEGVVVFKNYRLK
jgi:serine/threonine protein phosphatase PrpC